MANRLTDQAATSPRQHLDSLTDAIADSFAVSPRSPVLHTPADSGLDYEDVTFPSEDGIPLEGWFVPASPTTHPPLVVIVNHPRFFSRSGLPAHLEPWRSIYVETGNDIEVNLVPDITLLHDAGYHVLAYDLRNFGHSGSANGGVTSSGRFESRDVLGSLHYVRSRADLHHVDIALFSRCLGANATLFAISRAPEAFAEVRCLVACQPLSPRNVVERALERRGLPTELADDISRKVQLRTSFTLDDMSPINAARDVHIPTMLYQVRDDVTTRPSDVQAVFEALPGRDTHGQPIAKELFWIDGTTRRWDGYLHFQRDPDRILRWLAAHANPA